MEVRELVGVDSLNIAAMVLWASNYVWLPSTVYEVVTWVIGSLVGISLIALNSYKLYQSIQRDKKDQQKPTIE